MTLQIITCKLCGSLVNDGKTHIEWHQHHDDLSMKQWPFHVCPIDGSQNRGGSTSDDRYYVYWECGHSITFLTGEKNDT